MSHTFNTDHQSLAEVSRRRVLQAGGIGALMGIPGMVAAGIDGQKELGKGAARKSVIFILLCGGPSHLDTWDLKPEAPDGIRGPYKPISTSVPGMKISELHTRMATLTQHFSLIRSMTHVGNISNHFDAMHHLLSGAADSPPDAPYMGSILSKVRPNATANSIASYVWLIKCVGDPVFCAPNIGTGGHLGAVHSPLFVGSATNHPALPTFKAPEELYPAVSPDRMLDRRRLIDGLDLTSNLLDKNRTTKDWQELHKRAFDLTSGSAGRQPFELEREPAAVRDRYGRHPLGQNLLLARRLVEAGVGFVTVNGWTGVAPEGGGGAPSSSWDMHGGEMGMGNAFGNGSYGMGYCLPRLDEGLSALLTDLKDRGMLDNTMVVCMGEFGRTPIINAAATNPGRQHWPSCYSAIIAGGGIRGGAVYGESDKTAAFVKDKPVRPQDLGATIYHSLGVPLETRLGSDGFTRPISSGEPLFDLFG